MRRIAIIGAMLILSACGSTSTQPHASSPAPSPAIGTTTSNSSATAGTSPECGKPAGEIQQLVCQDPQLSALDQRLQVAYRQALDRPGADKAALQAAQNGWATTRDQCVQNTDTRTCLTQAFQTRLVQLALADPATPAPPVVTYRCPPENGPLTAQFYNELDPQTAVLTWKGDPYILFVQPSGSGARYGRQGIEYWEHQGEVRLDFNGTQFVCTTA
ncbi:Membrane-bound lysozyme-inhibitor of c-type lysozyme [Mycobacterium basiliense]|uniref:Membrane-bound lysozyme-inhibitor of c-type lysozyme n=1 Tax=Mycobacterium basiliense TaxID=2094119 RepID=A0A447GDV7_9MYCO|nr:lysozyme inhibitor LprI family protein [Mycobacterium basiliense]VDM88635.1 Membrane-bound lysozyme-inhibitor of c-type lysozyme [Mycobacterium basiliense]